MEIKVNKEVRDYTESIFLGLSFRQFLFSIIACVVAVIIYLSCVDILGMENECWTDINNCLAFIFIIQ